MDTRISNFGFIYDGADPAKAGPKTRSVARHAHRYYWDLVRAYDNHGYTLKAHRITGRQLNRAANALADLLTALARF